MAHPAAEAPSTAHTVAALFFDGDTGGEERIGRPWRPAVGKDTGDAGVGQIRAQKCDARRADHHAPATGRVDGGQRFEHFHLHDRIGLGPAQHCRQLQAEETRGVERIDGRRRQGGVALGFFGAGRQRGADGIDCLKQHGAGGDRISWE